MIEAIDEYSQYAYFKHIKAQTYYREEQHTFPGSKLYTHGLITVSISELHATIKYSPIEYIHTANWVQPCSKEEFLQAIQQVLTEHKLTL